ncbi:MAG: NAD(P)-binding protein [Betaproteobacteria bacterium]|nr:NAD(P)-binding protein [Betaproteobacteria bacterium]
MTRATRGESVVIVGGGWAGMQAAAVLSRAGVPVTVCEGGPVLGGRARRVRFGNVSLDNGQHLMLGAYRETLGAIAECGAGQPGLDRRRLRLETCDGARIVCPALPSPFHLVAALAGAKGLSVADKWAALRMMASLRASGFQLPDPVSVERLLRDFRQPAGVRRTLWDPLCVAALNTEPGKADARIFLNVLRDSLAGARAASDLVFAKTDLSAIFPEPAARVVRDRGNAVALTTTVRAIDVSTSGFDVTTSRGRLSCTHVICATDPARAPLLLDGLPDMQRITERIAGMRHESIVTVYLAYDPPIRLPGPMIGDPAGPAQWFFDRDALNGQKGWLAGVISAADGWHARDRAELARSVGRQCQRAFGHRRQPVASHVVTERRATFACEPGLERPGVRTPLPRLFLAGDYTEPEYPATLESAVRSGTRSAEAILETL